MFDPLTPSEVNIIGVARLIPCGEVSALLLSRLIP